MIAGMINGHRARHLQYGALARAVRDQVLTTAQGCIGGYVDNHPTTLVAHGRNHRATEVKHSMNIDIECIQPLGISSFLSSGVIYHSGAVNDDIRRADKR